LIVYRGLLLLFLLFIMYIKKTNDTIAAISTALSPGGIGIVRISGEESFVIADKVYRGKNKITDVPSHTINYGFIVDGDEVIDQVLVMKMKAPRSFTGEDVVEIQCHGGVLVMKRILASVIDAGASQAEPGEFTKRAFLNGKMDLSQAEAVADIIDAENKNALRVGVDQLKGNLSYEIREIRTELLEQIAFIEAALDDPEHYSLEGYNEKILEKVEPLKERVQKLISNSRSGLLIKSGIDTVILGKPNAGKSSIYNLLAGTDRAIVTDIAGTTRDTLTDNIMLGDIKLNITDTAGLRESEDTVEKIGVLRAKSAASNADLLICVIEISSEIKEEDLKILDFTKGKQQIILLNKVDIFSGDLDEIIKKIHYVVGKHIPVIPFSAKDGIGLMELTKTVQEMFFSGQIDLNDQIFVTNVRHQQALKKAYDSLLLVEEGAQADLTEDLISVDLTDAYEALGEIIGETLEEDIVNEIFAKFCMGK